MSEEFFPIEGMVQREEFLTLPTIGKAIKA